MYCWSLCRKQNVSPLHEWPKKDPWLNRTWELGIDACACYLSDPFICIFRLDMSWIGMEEVAFDSSSVTTPINLCSYGVQTWEEGWEREGAEQLKNHLVVIMFLWDRRRELWIHKEAPARSLDFNTNSWAMLYFFNPRTIDQNQTLVSNSIFRFKLLLTLYRFAFDNLLYNGRWLIVVLNRLQKYCTHLFLRMLGRWGSRSNGSNEKMITHHCQDATQSLQGYNIIFHSTKRAVMN